jgi:iron complex outermembrane recepter protein
MMTRRIGAASTTLAAMTIFALVRSTVAQAPVVQFDLPAADLAVSLRAVAKISGIQIIIASDAVKGMRAPALRGTMTVDEAVARLLAKTGVTAQYRDSAILVGVTAPSSLPDAPEPDIVVTGTHIRGGKSGSPIFSFQTSRLKDEGITDMRGVAAAIPQNFTGGQNPGVGNGAENSGSQNGDSTTALNLRGLGPDATLTLLNGHRMVYGLNSQSVDLSSIPLAAVERVDIMPDGASAVYGSDAVGGVANVVLRRDYDGLTANAVIGGAADGGDFDQNYSIVGGRRWASGGVVLTGNFDRSTAVDARDRSVTASMNGDSTVFPAMKSYGFLGSAHQTVGGAVTATLDAYYSHRTSATVAPYDPTGPATVDGSISSSRVWSAGLDPSVAVDIGRWKISAVGDYGLSHTDLDTGFYSAGSDPFISNSKFRNRMESIELGGEGPLFKLPAGDVRLAIGAGYRRTHLSNRLSSALIEGSQDNYYGYGEISAPLVSPELDIPAVYRLSLDAAYRYEDYPGSGRVGTPKVGLAWAPVRDLDLKASWGRSFKAPTLFQRLYQPIALIYPSDLFGARVTPDTRPIVEVFGGRPDLKPERATSLSATIGWHPSSVPGLNVGVTYFKVNYRDRVVSPIVSLSQALVDPAYAPFVQFNPSAAAVDYALALSPTAPINETGGAFDPSQVAAIIDGRYQNVSSEHFRGVDETISYAIKTEAAGAFNLDADATYLTSRRSVLAGEALLKLAGTIFNPPHFKARGGLTWAKDGASASAIVNFIGGVTDNRFGTTAHVASMTTLDLSVKRHLGRQDHGLDLQFSMLNVLNAKPDIVRTDDSIDQPFDFTNYSAIGRFVSVSLTRSF